MTFTLLPCAKLRICLLSSLSSEVKVHTVLKCHAFRRVGDKQLGFLVENKGTQFLFSSLF